MSGEPTAEEGKYKDIPSILPLAPGGVYAVKWEQREKWAECLKVPEVPYTFPLGAPNPNNPVCFFEIRAGGYYLGRVTFELKADTHPVTSENFLKLCEFKCYAGTMFKVFPGNWIRGGDFTDLDEVIHNVDDPEYFDFATFLPNPAKGGQSIYVSEDGPYFDDESFVNSHDGPGIITMYNPGAPNCNGSQFIITLPNVRADALDGTHVAFGQVIDGWNVIAALEQLGDARQEGETFQRVTVEQCGLLKQQGGGQAVTAGLGGVGRVAAARRGARRVSTKAKGKTQRFGVRASALAARTAYA
jgi:cyclophilin family peptidyl-prolyl cis-trans isomerase|tara:strand:- start:4735 stop:5637 length:903 start_codon:yes stop_codon:yes gene_type:complete